MPDISVITSTFNRKDLLLEKLESLKLQSLEASRFEWLVLVNADDGSFEALQAAETAFELRVLKPEKPIGIGAARNVCIREAKGRILYFSDDDCLLEPDTLVQHVAAQRQACVAIGGIDFIAESREQWQPKKVSFWNLNGANSSVPRADVLSVGLFDERIEGYGGEDLLLGYKLVKQGLVFKAVAAGVRHMGPNPMRGKNLEKAFSAGRNASRIAGFYPDLAFQLGVHPLLMGLKRFIFNPTFRVFIKMNHSLLYEEAYFKGALTGKKERENDG